jgi:outer membrane protein assembly factor BamB
MVKTEVDGTYKVGSSSEVNAPAISKYGTLYLVNADKLYALTSNKTLKWKFDNKYDLESVVIGANGTIYVGGNDYSGSHTVTVFYALNPSNGSVKWKKTVPGMYGTAPVIGSNHALNFATNGYTSGSTKYSGYLISIRDY